MPDCLEECEVPERCRGYQWVNLYEPNGYARLLTRASLKERSVDDIKERR